MYFKTGYFINRTTILIVISLFMLTIKGQENINLELEDERNWISNEYLLEFTDNIYRGVVSDDFYEDENEEGELMFDHTLKYFILEDREYALLVVEDRFNSMESKLSFCDLFLFSYSDKKIQLEDKLIDSNIGGMQDNSRMFDYLLQSGNNSVVIVLTGGLFFPGASFFDEFILIKDGRFSKLFYLPTLYRNKNPENKDPDHFCRANSIEFLESNKEMFDIQIKMEDCIEGKIIEQTIITFENGNYKIPSEYLEIKNEKK